jgi:hypothetical protein
MPNRQPRFYDFNVWMEDKRIEKLHYMHRNPVKRGLVRIHDSDALRMRMRDLARYRHPPLAQNARSGAPSRINTAARPSIYSKHIFNEANRRVPLRSPCISVHARWKVPLAFGKARLTDRRAGR